LLAVCDLFNISATDGCVIATNPIHVESFRGFPQFTYEFLCSTVSKSVMTLSHIFKMYGYTKTLIAPVVEAVSSNNSKSSKTVTSQ
jgi:hypothetical protein